MGTDSGQATCRAERDRWSPRSLLPNKQAPHMAPQPAPRAAPCCTARHATVVTASGPGRRAGSPRSAATVQRSPAPQPPPPPRTGPAAGWPISSCERCRAQGSRESPAPGGRGGAWGAPQSMAGMHSAARGPGSRLLGDEGTLCVPGMRAHVPGQEAGGATCTALSPCRPASPPGWLTFSRHTVTSLKLSSSAPPAAAPPPLPPGPLPARKNPGGTTADTLPSAWLTSYGKPNTFRSR